MQYPDTLHWRKSFHGDRLDAFAQGGGLKYLRTKTEKALAEATEQLDKLIRPDVRKTCKIKTVVRIGKPYREIIQFALEAQTDLVTMGCVAGGHWIERCLVRRPIG
jgi:hypothetical protein